MHKKNMHFLILFDSTLTMMSNEVIDFGMMDIMGKWWKCDYLLSTQTKTYTDYFWIQKQTAISQPVSAIMRCWDLKLKFI